MTMRTTEKTITFHRPFCLKGVDRLLPPTDYRVMTDEELIEGLSFPAYRRVLTAIFVPAPSRKQSSSQELAVWRTKRLVNWIGSFRTRGKRSSQQTSQKSGRPNFRNLVRRTKPRLPRVYGSCDSADKRPPSSSREPFVVGSVYFNAG